ARGTGLGRCAGAACQRRRRGAADDARRICCRYRPRRDQMVGCGEEVRRQSRIMTAMSPPRVMPPLLAFVAGAVVAFPFLPLWGFFAAQATGSFVTVGAQIAPTVPGV